MATDQSINELIAEAGEALAEAGFRTGDFGTARDLAEKARDEASRTSDVAGHAQALSCLGMVAHYENITKLISGSKPSSADVDSEQMLFRQSLLRWQELGEREAGDTAAATGAGTAQALFGLGLVFQVLHSDWMTAMPYFWQALDLVSKADTAADPYLRSEVHRHVGFYFLVEAGQPSEAVRHLQLSLDLREELADPRRIPSGLQALGRAELSAGNRDRAVELLTRAVAAARSAGLSQGRIEDAEKDLSEASGTSDADADAEPASADAAGESETDSTEDDT
jgi:tetratricopeptide (TPR) repeat protein